MRSIQRFEGGWYPGTSQLLCCWIHWGELNRWQCIVNQKMKKILTWLWRGLSWLPVLWRRALGGGWFSYFFDDDHCIDISMGWRLSWHRTRRYKDYVEVSRAIKDYLFLHEVFCLFLSLSFCIIQAPLPLSARYTNIIPVNARTCVFMFINC